MVHKFCFHCHSPLTTSYLNANALWCIADKLVDSGFSDFNVDLFHYYDATSNPNEDGVNLFFFQFAVSRSW